MRSLFAAVPVLVILGACTGADPLPVLVVGAGTDGGTASDIEGGVAPATVGPIVVAPVTLTAAPLRSFPATVTLERNGVTGPIHLSVLDAPAGVTVGEVDVPADASTATLQVSGAEGVAQVRRQVTLKAEAVGASATQAVDLVVRGKPGAPDTTRGSGTFGQAFGADDGAFVSMTKDARGRVVLVSAACRMLRVLPTGEPDATFHPPTLSPGEVPLSTLPVTGVSIACAAGSSAGESLVVAGTTLDAANVWNGWVLRLGLDGDLAATQPLYALPASSIPGAILADGAGGFRVVYEGADYPSSTHGFVRVQDGRATEPSTLSAATEAPTTWAFGPDGAARAVTTKTVQTKPKVAFLGFAADGTTAFTEPLVPSPFAGSATGIAVTSTGAAIGLGVATGSTFGVAITPDGKQLSVALALTEANTGFERIALDASGARLVAGRAAGVPVVLRYDAGGSLDLGFGEKGRVTLTDQGGAGAIDGLQLQDDGLLLLTRATSGGWRLTRLWL